MKSLAESPAEAEAELLADTSTYVEADTQVDMLHENLAEAEDQTLGNRRRDFKFKTMGMLHSR